MAILNCVVGSPPRKFIKFPPSIWGETFTSHVSHKPTICEWKEKAEILKGKVLEMLISGDGEHNTLQINGKKLVLIDAIQRLGVAYHFEEEIEEILSKIFTSHDCVDVGDDTNLGMVALRFRLLREHGYSVTSDVFKKFMDINGNFEEPGGEDVHGLLNLYEASYYRFHGEVILENALVFTTATLQCMLPQLNPFLKHQVTRALYRPLRKTLPRLEARHYLSVYEQTQDHSEILLSFAKFDFNILQKLHQEEVCIISKWWKELDITKNFPFARDKAVECYFWILMLYPEPQYSMARIFVTKGICMTSIMDDMYDNYGTIEELELFTIAIQRMDITGKADLPEYMKHFYQTLLDVYDEAEEYMKREGKSVYGVESAKQALKILTMAYFDERKWLGQSDLPTLEEYKNVSFVTSAYSATTISSIVYMDDVANEEAFNWALSNPKIVEAASAICRLMDDIVTYKFEIEREHPPSSVECYMGQYGGTEEEACEALRGEIEEAWKDINVELVRPTPVEKSVLIPVLNMARVMEFLYKESDGYSNVTEVGKECIASLLINAVEH